MEFNKNSKIFNVKLESRFTTLPNSSAEDPNLSWQAKGLLWYLCSRPEDWSVYIHQLSNVCQTGKKGKSRDAIRSMMKELIENGYARHEKTRNEKGQWQHNYYVFPLKIQDFQKMFPEPGNPALDFPEPEKAALLINTEANKKGKEEEKEKIIKKEKEEPASKVRADKPPSSSPQGLRLSKFLFSFLKEKDEAAEEPNFDKWAKELDIMHKKGRDWAEIEALMEFAMQDVFWQGVIQSTKSFRKSASRLKLQMDKAKNNKNPAKLAEEKEELIKKNKLIARKVKEELNLDWDEMQIDVHCVFVKDKRGLASLGYAEHGFEQQLDSLLRKAGYRGGG